jgi:Ca-activated chloride channel family protein
MRLCQVTEMTQADQYSAFEKRCLTAVFAVLFAVASSLGQAIAQELHIVQNAQSPLGGDKPNPSYFGRQPSTLRVNVDLVLVPVTVTDSLGRCVTGLDKQNFRIYEGEEEQAIRHFSSEDSPVSLGIIFDTSGSMKDKLERARDAVNELLDTANPQDELFLITFANSPELVTNFTNSVEDLRNHLLYITPRGSTALLDAIYMGVSEMRQARYPKKALLIISDGGDNHSRYREREIRSLVREAGTLVYAIGIYDQYFSTIEEQRGPALLNQISEETGGRMFTVDNLKDLVGAAARVSVELRNQYVLGYRPKDPKCDGKWHKIKVTMSPPLGLPVLTAHAKKGYYAPSE